ncbi:MAG: hypothetical protein AB7O38_28810, partial [Pirellulaceae bacterium]
MSIKFIRVPCAVLLLCSLASLAMEPRTHGEWQDVKIPDAWKTPRRGMSGYAWYRCRLTVPASW